MRHTHNYSVLFPYFIHELISYVVLALLIYDHFTDYRADFFLLVAFVSTQPTQLTHKLLDLQNRHTKSSHRWNNRCIIICGLVKTLSRIQWERSAHGTEAPMIYYTGGSGSTADSWHAFMLTRFVWRIYCKISEFHIHEGLIYPKYASLYVSLTIWWSINVYASKYRTPLLTRFGGGVLVTLNGCGEWDLALRGIKSSSLCLHDM